MQPNITTRTSVPMHCRSCVKEGLAATTKMLHALRDDAVLVPGVLCHSSTIP